MAVLPLIGWVGVLSILAAAVGAALVAVCLDIGRAIDAVAVIGVVLTADLLWAGAVVPPIVVPEVSLGASGTE